VEACQRTSIACEIKQFAADVICMIREVLDLVGEAQQAVFGAITEAEKPLDCGRALPAKTAHVIGQLPSHCICSAVSSRHGSSSSKESGSLGGSRCLHKH
jgi:hypothetical protein